MRRVLERNTDMTTDDRTDADKLDDEDDVIWNDTYNVAKADGMTTEEAEAAADEAVLENQRRREARDGAKPGTRTEEG
jgi:hypothetical protein